VKDLLRYACSPQLESAEGVRINRLRTAGAETQINFPREENPAARSRQ